MKTPVLCSIDNPLNQQKPQMTQVDDKYFLQTRVTEAQIMVETTFQAPDTQNDQTTKYSLRSWWVCLQAHKEKHFKHRVDLYERALSCIPNCYKLWFNYLKEQLENLKNEKSYLSPRFTEVNNLFERALIYMHKMPNIWLLYCDFLASQNLITRTRDCYDRALTSLPVTQHERIWKKYTEWVSTIDAVKTAQVIFERYIHINPDAKEDFVDYLVSKSQWDKAAAILVDILNDDAYNSHSGKSKYDFLSYLCDIISMHPHEIQSIDCANIMFYGIKKYSDEVGLLWIRLADYYIKLGLFEKARDVFEEALESIQTAKDFTQIFNAYVKFEESLITMLDDQEEEGDEDDEIDDTELARRLNKILKIQDEEEDVTIQDEIDMKLHRLETLLDRRPLLLNSCSLRQNRQNVSEWLNRVKLVSKDERLVLKTFKDALETIDPLKADLGKLSDVWFEYGKFYRTKGDYKSANQIICQGTKVMYKNVEEYVNIWSKWTEMLLEDGFHEDAMAVIKQALFKKFSKQVEERNAADLVPFSLQLWELYLDIERNFGTFQTLRAAYKRMLELKVITPFVLINYAQLLEDNSYFEESFKVFEAGVALFTWPALYEIWILYITKFIARYKGQKVERVRNLFETVLETVPQDKCKIFYAMYGEFEEQYGLLNHAIEIYDRMVFNVDYKDKVEAYNIYIAKVAQYLGITKTRAVFESAIENLKEQDVIHMGLRLAQLERKFGEIDRARAIYMHIAQFNDPRYDDYDLWKTWENFEMHHGNEDTYKDLKRVSKSVISKFNLLPPDPNKIRERVEKGQI